MRKKYTQVDEKKTGENIDYFIKEADISLLDLARKLDVTPNAVRNYIKGFNLPNTEKMYQICKILNVDIKDIIVEKQGGDE